MESDEIGRLKRLIDGARRIVGFTGAGISTDSGIPDYRSQGGIWDRFQPVYYEEFLTDPEKRLLYWQRKWELWPAIARAVPGPGHELFGRLYRDGKLHGLITQNVDGLHEKSGLPSDVIVNLHGTAIRTTCLRCGNTLPSSEVYETYNLADGPPRCRRCDGLLKPVTVSFGQNLDPEDLARADALARSADLMLVMGSTLVVYPAASIPTTAKQHGASLVIITLSETPLDDDADLVINRPIAEVVEELLA